MAKTRRALTPAARRRPTVTDRPPRKVTVYLRPGRGFGAPHLELKVAAHPSLILCIQVPYRYSDAEKLAQIT